MKYWIVKFKVDIALNLLDKVCLKVGRKILEASRSSILKTDHRLLDFWLRYGLPKLKTPLTLGYQAIPKIQIITNIRKLAYLYLWYGSRTN